MGIAGLVDQRVLLFVLLPGAKPAERRDDWLDRRGARARHACSAIRSRSSAA